MPPLFKKYLTLPPLNVRIKLKKGEREKMPRDYGVKRAKVENTAIIIKNGMRRDKGI